MQLALLVPVLAALRGQRAHLEDRVELVARRRHIDLLEGLAPSQAGRHREELVALEEEGLELHELVPRRLLEGPQLVVVQLEELQAELQDA